MGSYNHALVQGNLVYLLRIHSQLTIFTELSLATSGLDKIQFPYVQDELIPDICAYPCSSLIDLDILVMDEMPDLILEVVSPLEGAHELVQKFQAYFALGIHSCWLVDPTIAAVRVYHQGESPVTFSAGDVVDDVVNLKIPVAEIFE
ncbi:MAG: Uma2 family endonuclease [Caldilineaceae bacterium]